MGNLTTPLFIVIVSNAGGEGKTLLAQLIQALLQLAGDPVILLDGDAGNQAAKVADADAKVVGWGVDAIKARDILAATSHAHVILDLGANSLASAREIVELLPALRGAYAEAGYRTLAFLPVSTNKLGAVEAIKTLAPKIEGFEKLFVKVNRDGSRAFGGTLEGSDVVEVGRWSRNMRRSPATTRCRSGSAIDRHSGRRYRSNQIVLLNSGRRLARIRRTRRSASTSRPARRCAPFSTSSPAG